MDKLLLAQSLEAAQDKRREIVWQIDKKPQEQAVRPIMYHGVGTTF